MMIMRSWMYGLMACLLLMACDTDFDADPPAEPDAPRIEASLEPEPDSVDARLFDETMDFAREQNLHERPIGEIMQRVGERFKGQPYVVGPLDATPDELLVCRLDGFDCYTFVDAMLALGRSIKAQDYSYHTYAWNTRDQRYRGGQMDGYCTRLHYFSEWIADNEARGNVRDITEDLGGQHHEKALTFMSENREAYPRFAEDDEVYACIQEMEADLTDLEHYYIPQDEVHEVYAQLRAGDIVAFATDIGGLDVTHTGLIYAYEDGSKGVLHASTQGSVILSPDVQEYVQNVDRQIGIVVARPLSE